MKVLVTGSRYWFQRPPIQRELEKLPKDTILIHGNCIGADLIAASVARTLYLATRAYPAKWAQFGDNAGPLRNREMLIREHTEDEPIDLVLAFSSDFTRKSGTKDMCDLAESVGIRVQKFTR
jgi:hypothetical protein